MVSIYNNVNDDHGVEQAFIPYNKSQHRVVATLDDNPLINYHVTTNHSNNH
jgi:hypothetical protein